MAYRGRHKEVSYKKWADEMETDVESLQGQYVDLQTDFLYLLTHLKLVMERPHRTIRKATKSESAAGVPSIWSM